MREKKRLLTFDYLIYTVFFIISLFLMWKTFRIDPGGNMKIAVKVWSDFAANIPLIRSFSLGSNFPPQYPLFSGPPIKYHFLFYLLVGLLEKIGVRLDWALNTLSAIGFSLLLVLIYKTAISVFQKRSVAILSVILFLFNGSFAFLEFFREHPLNLGTLSQIIKNVEFASFGPYDGKIVSAFWNLNIYTNQRHLAFAYAFFLLLSLLFYKFAQNPKKLTYLKTVLLGVILGLFPFFHLAVFAMCEMALGIFFLIYPHLKRKIFLIVAVSLFLAIPQFLYIGFGSSSEHLFHPGYLIKNGSLAKFISYWFFNLGLSSILFIFGLIVLGSKQRKFFLPFLFLFIIGNLFQFSPDIATNHKFFNLFLIGANFFVAYFLVRLWRRKVLGKILVVVYIFFLTLSGIIDLFPIVNDSYVTILDYKNDQRVKFIMTNTPKNSTFLNSDFLYDPASLAGRKIYLGWYYFNWGVGYDTETRKKTLIEILNSKSKKEACMLLDHEGIDFIEIKDPPTNSDFSGNYGLFKNNFVEIFRLHDQNYSIYSVGQSCKN